MLLKRRTNFAFVSALTPLNRHLEFPRIKRTVGYLPQDPLDIQVGI